MSNILKNKNQLENYLTDFHPNKKDEILNLFQNFNFECGATSFNVKMKSLIGMPKFGEKMVKNGWMNLSNLTLTKMRKMFFSYYLSKITLFY